MYNVARRVCLLFSNLKVSVITCSIIFSLLQIMLFSNSLLLLLPNTCCLLSYIILIIKFAVFWFLFNLFFESFIFVLFLLVFFSIHLKYMQNCLLSSYHLYHLKVSFTTYLINFRFFSASKI